MKQLLNSGYSCYYIMRIVKWLFKNIICSCAKILRLEYNNNIRKSLMNLKTKHDLNESVMVVYRIPCNQCNYCCIGENERTLSQGFRKHMLLSHAYKSHPIS